MALHRAIHRLLLAGAHRSSAAAVPLPPPPAALAPVIEAVAPTHLRFDRRAVHFGDRYRSGFWTIYLLSAVAVLFAVLPLALGWDSDQHRLHPYAGLWALGEVIVIGTVSAIYWRGQRSDWQGQWLAARTSAELSWYLPMLAPLIDRGASVATGNWYALLFDTDAHVEGATEVAALCARIEPIVRAARLEDRWSQPEFVASYGAWVNGILQAQQHYHREVAAKQRALLHRIHAINGALFGLTALAALTHLIVHTLWLSLLTTFFPALGASLHGALAQSEAYRLSSTSERLVAELGVAIDRIGAATGAAVAHEPGASETLRAEIRAVLALILEEHHDWNLMVRPHHLPLA